ncbi:calmodulin-like protein 1 [Cucurbita maxima]|uniref:Calmodulin-like protein 1 n=1 Tax=Cucurbita maxima TaxID=3661 RepID=A0A6J1I9X0_CUCMA|nr:calmodulin-like protein 1 [Cucurbita maxima]
MPMNSNLLDLQYSVLKKKFLREPSRLFSFKNRQSSGLRQALQPSMEEIKQIFKWFDTNRDGRISKHEYRGILEALGRGSSMEEVQKIFKAVDTDGDGYINLNEFMEVLRSGVQTREVESAFKTFDVNGDQKISAEEVMRVLKGLGEKCSIEDCRRMVRAVDRNGDGMVDMDEFMTMMTRSAKYV